MFRCRIKWTAKKHKAKELCGCPNYDRSASADSTSHTYNYIFVVSTFWANNISSYENEYFLIFFFPKNRINFTKKLQDLLY